MNLAGSGQKSLHGHKPQKTKLYAEDPLDHCAKNGRTLREEKENKKSEKRREGETEGRRKEEMKR